MKKTIKTENAVTVFNLLNGAKLSAMDDEAKLAMFKICRQLKPIVVKFYEEKGDAEKTLVPYEGFGDDWKKALNYQTAVKSGKECKDYTEEEYRKFLKDYVKYNELIDKAILELKDKEVELEMPEVTEETFDKLCFANDWTFKVRDEFNVLTA